MIVKNPEFQSEADLHRNGVFKGRPWAFVYGIDGVRYAINHPEEWFRLVSPTRFNVKSDWLVALVGEIAAQQHPYNAVVHRIARERLGLPPLSEADNAKEGTPLSTLIYNAQCYRHSDEVVAQGFSELDERMLKEAFDRKRKIELKDGTVLTVREVRGKLYAFKPRKRTTAVALGYGTPARIV